MPRSAQMIDPDTAFRFYRRAQEFLGLDLDEPIDPEMWGEGELSEAERLVAELAYACNEAMPRIADADTDNEFRVEACKRWPHDDNADLRGAFIDGAAFGYGLTKDRDAT